MISSSHVDEIWDKLKVAAESNTLDQVTGVSNEELKNLANIGVELIGNQEVAFHWWMGVLLGLLMNNELKGT